MSEDIRQRIDFDVQQGSVTIKDVANDFERVEPAAKKAGQAGQKAGSDIASGLKQAQQESRRLEKTIAEQEKLTQKWRQELLRVETAQKAVGKNKREYFQLQKAAQDLNRAIKENVTDIKALKLDKKQVDSNVKQLKNQEKAIEGNTTATNGLVDRIEKGFSAIGINISGVTRRFKDAGDAIGVTAKQTGSFASAQNAATAATGNTSKSLRVLRIALISTGIGAIVVALGTLIAAFLSTQRGTDALTRALAPLKATLQVIIGVVQDLATDVVDAFKNPQKAIKDLGKLILDNIINRFTAIPKFAIAAFNTTIAGFDFLGAKIREIVADIPALNKLFDIDADKAAKDAAAAVENINNGLGDLAAAQVQFILGLDEQQQKAIGDVIEDAFERGNTAGNRLVDINVALEELAIRRAKAEGGLRNEYAKQRDIAADVNKTAEEREAAGNKAIEAQQKLFAFEKERLDLEIEAQRIKNSLNDTSRADELALQELIAERKGLEADFADTVRREQRQINTVKKASDDEEKKLQEERLKREQEIADIIAAKRLELTQIDADQYEIRRQQAEAYYAELLEREGVTAEQQVEIRQLLADERARIDLDEKEAYLRREQELIDGLEGLRLSSVEKEIADAKSKYDRLFELAEGNAEATKEIEENLARDIKDIRDRAQAYVVQVAAESVSAQLQAAAKLTDGFAQLAGDQAKDSQGLALFQIGLNTAVGVANAVAQGAAAGPPPANLIAIATGIAAVLSGIAQAKSALSTPPSFYDGTEYVQRGKNPMKKDSVPANLHHGEAVITAEKNKKYRGLAKAFNAGQVEEWAASHFFDSRLANMKVVHSVVNKSTSNFNDKRMVSAIQKTTYYQKLAAEQLQQLGKTRKFKRAG